MSHHNKQFSQNFYLIKRTQLQRSRLVWADKILLSKQIKMSKSYIYRKQKGTVSRRVNFFQIQYQVHAIWNCINLSFGNVRVLVPKEKRENGRNRHCLVALFQRGRCQRSSRNNNNEKTKKDIFCEENNGGEKKTVLIWRIE